MPKYVTLPHTPTSLRAMAATLGEQADQLRAVADAIEGSGFTSLPITNNAQRKQVFAFLDSFVSAARVALRDAREARGDFGLPATTSSNGHAKRTKK
jgi:hypothetical protein